MTKYEYMIIDTFDGDIKVIGFFEDLDKAKDTCYQLRKKRYAKDNPAMEQLYDYSPFDNQYNVMKVQKGYVY